MKKVLSVLLSIMMLMSVFSISSFEAFAYSKNEAPTVSVGDTFVVDYDSVKINDYAYFAKFVPQTTGYYEFSMDTGVGFIRGEVEVYIFDSNNGLVYEDYMDSTYPEALNFAIKLRAGRTYYFTVAANRCGTYTSNVTIKKHTHKLVDARIPAIYYYDEDFDMVLRTDGGYYKICIGCDGEDPYLLGKTGDDLVYAGYAEKQSSIYYPKKMTLSRTSYTYDGKKKTPSITVEDRQGARISSRNYTVTYENATRVGTATARITFNDEKYMGEMYKEFDINPKGTTLSSVSAKSKGLTVNWNKQGVQTTGYQIQVSTDSAGKKNVKTYKVSDNKTLSKSISGLKANTKYYVRVRTYKVVSGRDYYSGWSGYKAVTTK